MSIVASDPLAFLIAQGGVVGTPLSAKGASGAQNLDVKQRGAVIGEPIPIVFCRRVGGVGGVLISPAATEARFENNINNDVTASYHLVLSEGLIDSLQVRDVFQRSCRVGSFSQTYGKRAGTFVAGNFLQPIEIALVQFSFDASDSATQTWYNARLVGGVWRNYFPVGSNTEVFLGVDPGDVRQVRNTGGLTLQPPEAPSYCGTSGTYAGLSTMAFSVTIPAGFDQWDRQVHVFSRGGIHVLRLLDSVTGPSNNVSDLLLYLLRNSSRVPEAQISSASLLAGATFTDVNGFWFNGEIIDASNLRDWINESLKYFLLRQIRIGGKEGVAPLVPTNSNGTIKTTAVNWEFTFAEQHIIPDSFDIIYTPLTDRKPFVAMVLWRQQDDLGIPLIRTAEVRYSGTATDGPYEQHDISAFCASENHAVKVGAYIISKRRHVTHRLQIDVRPDAFNPTLAAGDLVRVRLERTPSTGGSSLHDYLYEVDRIGKSISGKVRLELTHFPVDSQLRSLVALEVDAATGAGFLLPTGLTGVTCDVNSSSDISIPADTSLDPGNLPDSGSFEIGISELEEGEIGEGGDNPSIPSFPQPTPTSDGDIDSPVIGDTLGAPAICEGGIISWFRLDPSVEGGRVFLGGGPSYTMVINDVDLSVYFEIVCPDPASSTGYGEPITSAPTGPIDEWNRFAETGEFVVYRGVSQEVSALRNCETNDITVEASSFFQSSVFFASRFNVVGYRVGVNFSQINYVCPGGVTDSNTATMGVFVIYSNNTTEFIGTNLSTGNRFLGGSPAAYGTRTEIWTISITVGGTPIYS